MGRRSRGDDKCASAGARYRRILRLSGGAGWRALWRGSVGPDHLRVSHTVTQAPVLSERAVEESVGTAQATKALIPAYLREAMMDEQEISCVRRNERAPPCSRLRK